MGKNIGRLGKAGGGDFLFICLFIILIISFVFCGILILFSVLLENRLGIELVYD